MERRLKIAFFFPYYRVGGVPVLFARLARRLVDDARFDVAIIDYRDGYMSRTLADEPRITKIVFQRNVELPVEANTLLVMQGILPATIPVELAPSPQTRLLFWTLHPLNWVQTLVPLPALRDYQARHPSMNRAANRLLLPGFSKDLVKALRRMHEKGSLVFMDGSTLASSLDRLGMSLTDPVIIPVPCDVPDVPRPPRCTDGTVNIVWVGRLADFKIHILKYTIAQASRLARQTGQRIRMHVIGDGPLEAEIDAVGGGHETFEIIKTGPIEGAVLDRYLFEHADLLAAMGTSALEGAKLGIPTLLVDLAYGPIRDGYVYRWLDEARDYSLGDFVTAESYRPGNDSLAQAVKLVRSNSALLARRMYQYVRDKHDLGVVTHAFAKQASQASFLYGEIPPSLRRKSLLRRSYELVRSMTERTP